MFDQQLLAHLSPLKWQHINLTGDIIGDATEAYEIASCVHFEADRFQPILALSVRFFTNGGVTPYSWRVIGRR
jgi:hypothetical protein